MTKKVLVAEDIASLNKGLEATLKEKGAEEIQFVQYCDDAYLKIKKAINDNEPFDLLVTDLSFKEDHREPIIENGESLLKTIDKDNIQINKIVFSIEDRLQKVKQIFKRYKIDAYVCKGRRDQVDMAKALDAVLNKTTFASAQVEQALSNEKVLDIDEYDIKLLEQLQIGNNQVEISAYFKKQKINPSSISAIEKRINKLKISLKAKNSVHLIAKAKDIGLV